MPKFRTYIFGFSLSVVLTLLAFVIVAVSEASYWIIVLAILSLAVVQLLVQLYFFLHLSDEARPRLKLQTFLAAAIVVIIVVFGSLWIIEGLSKYHGHEALKQDVDEYIQDEEAIYKEPQSERN